MTQISEPVKNELAPIRNRRGLRVEIASSIFGGVLLVGIGAYSMTQDREPNVNKLPLVVCDAQHVASFNFPDEGWDAVLVDSGLSSDMQIGRVLIRSINEGEPRTGEPYTGLENCATHVASEYIDDPSAHPGLNREDILLDGLAQAVVYFPENS